MNVLHFMNEVPYAFPAALAEEIHKHGDVNVTIASFYDDVGQEVRDGPVEVIKLGGSGKLDLRAYRHLRRIIVDRDIDIVHTHPNATGSLARLVASTTGVKVIDTRHNDHRHFPWHHRLPNIPTTVATDRYISNSKSTQSSFSRLENLLLRLTGGQQEVIYNGINSGRIQDLPPEPKELPDGPRVICVARYVQQKNHETLVRAMKYVQEEIPDVKLVLVGDGSRFDEITSLIKELDLEEIVVQTGYLPQRVQVLSAVQNSQMFAIASWYEGFCIAAIEAMLSGTPVIASDIKVLREVVGDTGVYADPNDPQEFAHCITNMLEDSKARRQFGEAAQERAKAVFSLDRTASEYVRVYRELMAGGN